MEKAVAALRLGHLVLLAPEGGISRSFELLPFHTGAARMSRDAGVPLIPSVSWGSQRLSTTGQPIRILESFGIPITVRFGSPLYPMRSQDVTAATAMLRDRMAMMLDKVQRTYPDGLPAGAYWVPARLGGSAISHELVLREHGLLSNVGPRRRGPETSQSTRATSDEHPEGIGSHPG
jgi:Acyltransferase